MYSYHSEISCFNFLTVQIVNKMGFFYHFIHIFCRLPWMIDSKVILFNHYCQVSNLTGQNMEIGHPLSFIHLIHSSIRSFIHSSIILFIHSFIHPLIHYSIHPLIYSSINPFIRSSIHTFIHSSIHQFNHLIVSSIHV